MKFYLIRILSILLRAGRCKLLDTEQQRLYLWPAAGDTQVHVLIKRAINTRHRMHAGYLNKNVYVIETTSPSSAARYESPTAFKRPDKRNAFKYDLLFILVIAFRFVV